MYNLHSVVIQPEIVGGGVEDVFCFEGDADGIVEEAFVDFGIDIPRCVS